MGVLLFTEEIWMKEADRSTDSTVPGGYKLDLSQPEMLSRDDETLNDDNNSHGYRPGTVASMDSLEGGIHLMDLSSAAIENRSTWIDGASLLSGRTLDHQDSVAEQPCRHCFREQPINRRICQNCKGLLQASSPDDPLVNVVLGERFRVNAYLHSGIGFDTFHATDLQHQQSVLLRLYPLGNRSPQTMFQFQSWGEACKNFQHPALTPMVEVDIDPQWGGMWVEDISTGDSLFDFIERQKLLFLDHLLPMFRRLVEVLANIHRQGLVHGHLHMGGLRLSEHPKQALSDWTLIGCSAHSMLPLEQALERLSHSTPGSVLPFFPEMAQPMNSLGPETDVYRLGALLFELVTSQPLFVGESMLHIYQQHRDRVAPTLLMARPDIPAPPGLQDLLAKSLAKHPQQRHSSVEAWLAELTEVIQNSNNVLLPKDVFQPKSTPMSQHLRDASNELLAGCHRPTFREPVPQTWMLHHLSSALRLPNLQQLPKVERVMESFAMRPSHAQAPGPNAPESFDSLSSLPSLGYSQDGSGDSFVAAGGHLSQQPPAQQVYRRDVPPGALPPNSPSGYGHAFQTPSDYGHVLQAPSGHGPALPHHPSGHGYALQGHSGHGEAYSPDSEQPREEEFEFEWSWIHLVWLLVVGLFLTAFALFLFR